MAGLLAVLAFASPGVRAQTLNEREESCEIGFAGTYNLHWAVDWTYALGNPQYVGMLTYCKVFGYFITPSGNVNFNDITIAQYTFNWLFSGSKEWTFNINIPGLVQSQKPYNATALRFKIRWHSQNFWGIPQQWLIDEYTLPDYITHNY